MDPDDAPPEPAPGLTEQDIGFVGSTLDRIRAGGVERIIEEDEMRRQEAIDAGEGEDGPPDVLNTPYLRELMIINKAKGNHARRWRPRVIASLQMVPQITAACRFVGVSVNTVQSHRKLDPIFDAACTYAEDTGAAMVFARAHQLACDGNLEPVLHQGVVVTYVRKFNTPIQLAMLKAHYPHIFSRPESVKLSVKGSLGSETDMDAVRAHQIVSTLSPLMAARHLASLNGTRPPELPNQGGFIRLQDVPAAATQQEAGA